MAEETLTLSDGEQWERVWRTIRPGMQQLIWQRKKMKSNEFLNIDTFPFEVLGFWEEMIGGDGRLLGTISRPDLEAPDRPLGVEGEQARMLTAPLMIQKGHRPVMLMASAQRPVQVRARLHALCGRPKKTPTQSFNSGRSDQQCFTCQSKQNAINKSAL